MLEGYIGLFSAKGKIIGDCMLEVYDFNKYKVFYLYDPDSGRVLWYGDTDDIVVLGDNTFSCKVLKGYPYEDIISVEERLD